LNDDASSPPVIEPLTRSAKGGILARSPVVEAQMASALPLPPAQLKARATLADRGNPAYLQEECLVGLIRHFAKTNDRARINAIAEPLLMRCEGFTRQRLIGLGENAFEDGHAQIIADLFRRILDLSSDRDDFLQVKFWVRFERLTVDEFRRQLRLLRRQRRESPLSVLPGYDPQEGDQLERDVKPARGVAIATRSPEDDYLEAEGEVTEAVEGARRGTLLQEALEVLKGDVLAAFLLRHRDGMQIENQDPEVITISRLLGRTPRTIRTWLKQASAAIAEWRGGKL